MAKKDKEELAEAKADPLHEARERFDKALEYWNEDREAAVDDIRFRAGEQWPDEVKKLREKRPCLVVDKLNQYVRQIVNDGRQNRPSIKVRPVDSGADVATAEVFSGLIKHIEDRSNADTAYDTALDSAATCGFGFFRVLSEYTSNESFDQELVIRRIRNPLSVVIDPMAQEADGSDMKFAFVTEEISKDEFEDTYPNLAPDNWETDYNKTDYANWYGESVRIAEYWWVEEEETKLHKLGDGQIINDEIFNDAMTQGIPLQVVETRSIPKRVVKWCKMTGKDYIEKPKVWPGRYIPIMVVWGNEIDVEGKVQHSGIIRPAKDAQRLYNYSRSAFAERVALTPKAPWVAAEGQVEDYADEWNTANVENHSVLRYKPTSLNGTPVPPPQRQTASDIPAGFAQDMQISEHDIQGAIGMYAASLGAPSNERSGKAIQARQREGDVGTFHYHDNLNRAIRFCGKVLIDLIPKFYDTNRVVRIMGYDGTPGEAEIDPNQPTASQQLGTKMIYNLSVGTYDITVSAGPSYGTLRQEGAAAMIELVQANPALMQVAGDLIVKNQDWPGAEEFAERLKLTLPPEIQQAEAAKKQQSMPPEMQQIISQFEQVIQQKDQMMEAAAQQIEAMQQELQSTRADAEAKLSQAAAKQKEVEIKEKELMLKAVETEIKAYDSETKRLDLLAKAEADAQNAELQRQTSEQATVEKAATQITPIMQTLEQLTQAIGMMNAPKPSAPRMKRAKAVKQPDGSWAMESIEHEQEPQPMNEGVQ